MDISLINKLDLLGSAEKSRKEFIKYSEAKLLSEICSQIVRFSKEAQINILNSIKLQYGDKVFEKIAGNFGKLDTDKYITEPTYFIPNTIKEKLEKLSAIDPDREFSGRKQDPKLFGGSAELGDPDISNTHVSPSDVLQTFTYSLLPIMERKIDKTTGKGSIEISSSPRKIWGGTAGLASTFVDIISKGLSSKFPSLNLIDTALRKFRTGGAWFGAWALPHASDDGGLYWLHPAVFLDTYETISELFSGTWTLLKNLPGYIPGFGPVNNQEMLYYGVYPLLSSLSWLYFFGRYSVAISANIIAGLFDIPLIIGEYYAKKTGNQDLLSDTENLRHRLHKLKNYFNLTGAYGTPISYDKKNVGEHVTKLVRQEIEKKLRKGQAKAQPQQQPNQQQQQSNQLSFVNLVGLVKSTREYITSLEKLIADKEALSESRKRLAGTGGQIIEEGNIVPDQLESQTTQTGETYGGRFYREKDRLKRQTQGLWSVTKNAILGVGDMLDRNLSFYEREVKHITEQTFGTIRTLNLHRANLKITDEQNNQTIEIPVYTIGKDYIPFLTKDGNVSIAGRILMGLAESDRLLNRAKDFISVVPYGQKIRYKNGLEIALKYGNNSAYIYSDTILQFLKDSHKTRGKASLAIAVIESVINAAQRRLGLLNIGRPDYQSVLQPQTSDLARGRRENELLRNFFAALPDGLSVEVHIRAAGGRETRKLDLSTLQTAGLMSDLAHDQIAILGANLALMDKYGVKTHLSKLRTPIDSLYGWGSIIYGKEHSEKQDIHYLLPRLAVLGDTIRENSEVFDFKRDFESRSEAEKRLLNELFPKVEPKQQRQRATGSAGPNTGSRTSTRRRPR